MKFEKKSKFEKKKLYVHMRDFVSIFSLSSMESNCLSLILKATKKAVFPCFFMTIRLFNMFHSVWLPQKHFNFYQN